MGFCINGFSEVREKSKFPDCSVGSKNQYGVAHGHYLKYVDVDIAWFGSLLVIFYQIVFQLKSFENLYTKFNRKMIDILGEKHYGGKWPVNFEIMQDTWICILDNVYAQPHTDF